MKEQEGLSLASGRSKRYAINHEEVLAVLPDNGGEVKSIKGDSRGNGTIDHIRVDWVRAERRLVRVLGALIK